MVRLCHNTRVNYLDTCLTLYGTIWDEICLFVPLVISMRIRTILQSYEGTQVLAKWIETLLFGTLSNVTLGRSSCPISMCFKLLNLMMPCEVYCRLLGARASKILTNLSGSKYKMFVVFASIRSL